MKVYVVEFGSYSDRYVSAVFSTLEAAQAYIKANDRTWEAPTEFELDDHTVDRMLWRAGVLLEDGRPHTKPYPVWGDAVAELHECHPSVSEFLRYRPYVTGATARTPDEALKSARDHRARILAERNG